MPAALERGSPGYADRRVVMVASAGVEPSLADVVTNLATVCAEIGQRVALVSTAGLASPGCRFGSAAIDAIVVEALAVSREWRAASD